MQRPTLLLLSLVMTACVAEPARMSVASPEPTRVVIPSSIAPSPPPPVEPPRQFVVRTHCEDGRPVTTDGVCKKRGAYWRTICSGEAACSAVCDAGDARGCREARKARMLAARDGAAGRRYVERQCALGDRFGCSGLAYVDGQRARRATNGAERRRWQTSRAAALARGCEALRDGKACVSLAYDHANRGEASRAFRFALAGCSLGAELACVWTARAFIDGHGTRIDARRGLALLSARCQAQQTSGRKSLACRALERRQRYRVARGRNITGSGATTPR